MSAIQIEALSGCGGAARRVPVATGLANRIIRAADTLRTWRRRLRERDQLARLDDRMLRDIGLTPGDAEYLSRKPFWRE